MLPHIDKIKGIHPGLILKRELTHQDIRSSDLAHDINEHKQTISAILNQKRDINPNISIKLGKKFNIEVDYFMLLQASYDVKKAAQLEVKKQPNMNKFRKVIFWDTTFDKIDWDKHKRAIIQRILERGNGTEINEMISFYGRDAIAKEIKTIKKSRLPSYEKNIIDYNLV